MVSSKQIVQFVSDLDIIQVELVFGQIKLLTCEAFVAFSSSKDVEKALNLGKKVIGEIPIKIHRSSHEQMQFHCSSLTKKWLEVSPNNLKNNNGKQLIMELPLFDHIV